MRFRGPLLFVIVGNIFALPSFRCKRRWSKHRNNNMHLPTKSTDVESLSHLTLAANIPTPSQPPTSSPLISTKVSSTMYHRASILDQWKHWCVVIGITTALLGLGARYIVGTTAYPHAFDLLKIILIGLFMLEAVTILGSSLSHLGEHFASELQLPQTATNLSSHLELNKVASNFSIDFGRLPALYISIAWVIGVVINSFSKSAKNQNREKWEFDRRDTW